MKKKLIIIGIIVLIAACGFGAYRYMDTKIYKSDQFFKNTYINDVDCSGLTYKEAEAKLTKTWNKKTYQFKEKEKVVDKIKNLNFDYDIEKALKNAKGTNFIGVAASYYFGTKLEIKIPMTVSKISKRLMKHLKTAPAFQQKNPLMTKDAYIDLESKDFSIIPEVYGRNLDHRMLAEAVATDVADNVWSMDYREGDYYEVPKITSNSSEIFERQEYCEKYLDSKVTHTIGKEKIKIPPKDLDKMIKVKNDKVSVNKKAARKYVETLAANYSTIGSHRNFKSYSGNQIDVTGGIYGYSISVDGETKQLVKDLKKNKSVKREPVWAQKGWGDYDNDIGSTYVEINLSQQHIWYFKDGKQLVSAPIVTGNVADGFSTPAGTFQLTYKERDATLKGANADGSSYASPVSYWMPFYGNYGCHDAPWRDSFGGDIYRNNGSHGCVNMPVPAARTMFENMANSGTPVIVYY